MKYTIVVAEDEELLLNNLISKIEKTDEDFQVVGKAQTGSQAYDLVEQYTPDVVITDIRMPVMDGIALLTKVREQFPLTKFIITSGYSDFEYARSAIALQVSDYLLKPVDPEELERVLLKIKKEFQITKASYEEVFNLGTTRMTSTQIAHLLKAFLVENYAQDINLNLIANNLNYSSSYLTKIFLRFMTARLPNISLPFVSHRPSVCSFMNRNCPSARSEKWWDITIRDISAGSSKNRPAQVPLNTEKKIKARSFVFHKKNVAELPLEFLSFGILPHLFLSDDFHLKCKFFHARITSLTVFYDQFLCLILPQKLCGCISSLFKMIIVSFILI